MLNVGGNCYDFRSCFTSYSFKVSIRVDYSDVMRNDDLILTELNGNMILTELRQRIALRAMSPILY